MNGKIAKGPRRTTRRPAAGSRSQARATPPVRPFCAVRRSSTRATHSSVPTRDRSAGSSGSGIAAGRSPSSRGGPPPSELMSQPLAHEGRGKPARSEWEVPPHLWRRGLAGETGFPPRERAEGERRSYLLNHGRAEEARRSDEEHADQEREDVEVCVDRPARKVARGEGLGEANQETAQHCAGNAPDPADNGRGEALQPGGEAHQREDLAEDEPEHDASCGRERRPAEERERD